jgi:hypothetical protein
MHEALLNLAQSSLHVILHEAMDRSLIARNLGSQWRKESIPMSNDRTGIDATSGLPILATLWQVPAFLEYVHPPLTGRVVADAERLLGVSLPAEYLAALRLQNGGYIRYALGESMHECIWGIGPEFPTILGHEWDDYGEEIARTCARLIPFDGDGHWYLCFDYRASSSEPAIVLVDCESVDVQPEAVAPSFAQYLSLLTRGGGDPALGLIGELDPRTFMKDLSTVLALEYEDEPDTYAHGYPIFRAGMGKRSPTPEWVWLSPNLVDRGFVRPEEPDYEVQRRRLPGQALRWFEHPTVTWVLSATDKLDAAVRAHLARRKREFIEVWGEG